MCGGFVVNRRCCGLGGAGGAMPWWVWRAHGDVSLDAPGEGFGHAERSVEITAVGVLTQKVFGAVTGGIGASKGELQCGPCRFAPSSVG
jgi:hypothetical protein